MTGIYCVVCKEYNSHSANCSNNPLNFGIELQKGIDQNGRIHTIEHQVAHQEHYTQFPIQVMEFCHVNSLSWCAANVVKYVCREGKKDGVKDLYKAMDYLKCLIHFKETGVFLPPNKLAEVRK